MKALIAATRSRAAAIVFGLVVGLGLGPALDMVGEHRTYGSPAMDLDAFQCVVVANVMPGEIALVKRAGLSKRRYMAYLRESAPEDRKELADKIIHMASATWDSEDGGAAVVQECLKKALDKEKVLM